MVCNLNTIANRCAKTLKITDEKVQVSLVTTSRMKHLWPTSGICHGLILDPKPRGKPYVIVVNYEFYWKNKSNCQLWKELFYHELIHVKTKSRSHGQKFMTICTKLGIQPFDYTVPYKEV